MEMRARVKDVYGVRKKMERERFVRADKIRGGSLKIETG
ncbi:hypothetical protein COLO4_06668 [Corchorus olitorius]|uniref:Uncharacterized protein n=1 Tax=Corchorus olitorius TaxID=93759 RepID=A0A1R3KMB4_9ROSI|nr:hypothetical protein COLO4_06668 [Corchorus olitorius]